MHLEFRKLAEFEGKRSTRIPQVCGIRLPHEALEFRKLAEFGDMHTGSGNSRHRISGTCVHIILKKKDKCDHHALKKEIIKKYLRRSFGPWHSWQ